MKRFTIIIMLHVAAAVLLSACGRGFSITKRHYRKGYHIAFAGKTPVLKVVERAHVYQAPQEPILQVTVLAQRTDGVSAAGKATETHSLKRPVQHTAVASAIPKTTALSSTFSDRQIVRNDLTGSLKQARSTMASGSDDARSVIWLLIVILLLLWLFGFLTGGWGLGPVLHLVLVVALILFILWLLRII